MKLNIKSAIFTGIVAGLLSSVFILKFPKAQATYVDPCDAEWTYEKTNDFNDGRVYINFRSSNERIDVHAEANYYLIGIWLDVDNDGHSGYRYIGNNTLNDYNPSGDEINRAKVVVKLVCTTPSPTCTPRVTPNPTPEVTPEVTPEPTPEVVRYAVTQEAGQSGIPQPSCPSGQVCTDTCTMPVKPAIAIGGERLSNDAVRFSWFPSTDPHDKQVLLYGPSENQLIYSVHDLPSETGYFDVNIFDMGHWFFQIGTWRGACISWSNVIDP